MTRRRVSSAAPSRFDGLAAEWDANPVRVALASAVAGAIRRHVPLVPGMRMLDLGAGTGLISLQLRPHVGSVVAVDASQKMLDEIERKVRAAGVDGIRTLCWNVEGEPLPAAAFDVAVSSMTLHHVRDTALLFRRLHAALRPGGWLAVADLDREDGSFHGPMPDVHHHGFDRAAIVAGLAAAGFRAPAVHDAHVIERPDAGRYPVFLATARA